MIELTKEIRVVAEGAGWRIFIDDFELPQNWFSVDVSINLEPIPSVTVSLLAERVELVGNGRVDDD